MFARIYKPITAVLFSLLFLGFLGLTAPLYGQDAAEKEKPAKKKAPKAGQSAELEGDHFLTREGAIPQPVIGAPATPVMGPVRLSATYYYGNADKDTTPVLLLHGENGSRRDFMPLIDVLTNNGYAVLAADLRGHGKSVKRYELTPPQIDVQVVSKQQNSSGNGRGQKPKVEQIPVMKAPASKKLVDYLAADFGPEDYMGMARYDLPLLRENLEKVHVEGMVNLHRLVVVGVGRGAALAGYWAAMDWRDKNSGRFTKTLVMIAPVELDGKIDLAQGFSNNKWMKNDLSVLFAVPAGNTAAQGISERIRTAILEKNEDEKLAANFQIINYPTEKTVKSDKGDTKTEMSVAETFSSGEAKLGNTVFNFIDKRNKELEIRWQRLK